MVKQRPEMVEASSRYDPPKSILVPPEKSKKMTIFGSFSGLSEPSVVGDYKKSVSRASPVVCHQRACSIMQIMVKQWPEMVKGSSRYDPPKSILVPPEKTKNDQFWVIFWIVGTVSCWRLQEVSKSS